MPVISTNTAANAALRYLNLNSQQQSDSVAKLASGSRINKASDDAAGLAIGTRLRSDVTTLEQAATNASHGQSILQTADGGMSRIADILQRMKSLATQSATGSVTDSERAYIQAEFAELIEEVDGIATGTRFNGASLLDGTSDFNTVTGVDFMVGSSATDTINVTIADVSAATLGVSTLDVSTLTGAQAALTALDTAINTVSSARATVGAEMSRFDFRAEVIDTNMENLTAAESALMDVDVAAEKTALSSYDVKTQASIAALAQANAMPQELLALLQQ